LEGHGLGLSRTSEWNYEDVLCQTEQKHGQHERFYLNFFIVWKLFLSHWKTNRFWENFHLLQIVFLWRKINRNIQKPIFDCDRSSYNTKVIKSNRGLKIPSSNLEKLTNVNPNLMKFVFYFIIIIFFLKKHNVIFSFRSKLS
jgi:hypothetical protein